MKRTFCAVLLMLHFLLCACGPATWQKQYDLGNQYLTEGNYEEAITAFDSAIELDSQRAETYVGRGDAYIGLGDSGNNLEKALKDYETALGLDDGDQTVYLKIADIYLIRDDYEQLQEIVTRAKNKFGDTEEILEREKGLQTYQNYFRIGSQDLAGSNYDEAIRAFSTAIELDPGQADAYIGRGDAYIESGDTEENVAAALADYETALSLDSGNLSIYLKVADLYISRNELKPAQNALDIAADNFGRSDEILEREKTIQGQKDAQLTGLLLDNIWDISWQTSEHLIFFPNMHGIRLSGYMSDMGAEQPILQPQSEFPYIVENNTLTIVEDGYTQEWVFDESNGCFLRMVEEYGYTTEQYMDRVSPQSFFSDIAAVHVNEVIADSYWDDLLNLVLLYKKNFSEEDEAAALQKEQDEWQEKLNQEISSKGIDTKTRSGIEWRNYYVRARSRELLELPNDDPNPPVYRPILTEDEAMQIALDFWNISPGDIDPDTGYKLYVRPNGTVEKQQGSYYCFVLYWMVVESYGNLRDEHPTTIDMIYVNMQTGTCQRDVP